MPEPNEPEPLAAWTRRIDDGVAASAVLDGHPKLLGDVHDVLAHDRSPLRGRLRGIGRVRMRNTAPRWRAQRAEVASVGGEAVGPRLRRVGLRGGR